MATARHAIRLIIKTVKAKRSVDESRKMLNKSIPSEMRRLAIQRARALKAAIASRGENKFLIAFEELDNKYEQMREDWRKNNAMLIEKLRVAIKAFNDSLREQEEFAKTIENI